MLEKVKFNKKPMKKAEYKEQWDELLAKLVVLQQQAHNEGVGLVVLFEGWNGAGKGSRISDLMYHLDARSTGVYVGLDLDPDTEREFVGRECGVTGFYPIMQPFWKALGERNSITFYDRGWYTAVIQHMLYNAPAKLLLPKKEERHYLDSVHDFEQQLVSDGYVVVKFFVHMTKKAQVERLQRLHDDPVTRWRVTEKKLESHHGYETAYELYDRLLERSDYDFAPWVLLNGEDKRRTNLTIASTLVDALERALARKEADDVLKASLAVREKADELLAEERAVEAAAAAEAAGAVPAPVAQPGRGMLAGVALARAEAQAAAAHELAPKKSRFAIVKNYPQVDTIDHSPGAHLGRDTKPSASACRIACSAWRTSCSSAGCPSCSCTRGGTRPARAATSSALPRPSTPVPTPSSRRPAPTKPELAHPFLWRYWTRLPKAGHVGMYDRSWYGRVLVERVEGFATPEPSGRGPTTRSTSSSTIWSTGAPSC